MSGRFVPWIARALALSITAALYAAPGGVQWVRHKAGAHIPNDAIVAAREVDHKLYVCRAQLRDGVHPGATTGDLCLVPQKGKVEKANEYEVAVGRDYSWRRDYLEDAVIAGRQGRASDLYVCKARVVSSAGENTIAVGKTYRSGPHAGHCYVSFEGSEFDVTSGFEVLCSSIAPTTLGLCGIANPEWMEASDYSHYRINKRPSGTEADSAYLQSVVPTGHPESINAPYRGLVTRDGAMAGNTYVSRTGPGCTST